MGSSWCCLELPWVMDNEQVLFLACGDGVIPKGTMG